MSTGYDELYYAASNYGQNQNIVDEHEGNIGDAQELCSDAAEIINSLRRSNDELYEALEMVRSIISEGAAEGFNPMSGDWAERLFNSQQKTSYVVKKARGEM